MLESVHMYLPKKKCSYESIASLKPIVYSILPIIWMMASHSIINAYPRERFPNLPPEKR